MKKLPNKLSALMRIALKDIAKVEKSDNITVYMDSWIMWDYDVGETNASFKNEIKNNTCSVCFAGAVMAKTLDVTALNLLDDRTITQMESLDWIRCGCVEESLLKLEENISRNFWGKWNRNYPNQSYVDISRYEVNPKQWRKDMWKIVHKLEKIGL